MRITFLLERPTQFEAPFFRFAAQDPEHSLRVIYSDPGTNGAGEQREIFDPELGRSVSWGFDLLAGYEHAALPPAGRGRFWRDELAARRPSLLVVNGYTHRAYLQAAWAAKRAGVRAALRLDSVPWGHDRMGLLRKRLLYAVLLGRLFPLFLAVGSLSRQYLAAVGVPAARVGLFPYAVDHERFHAGSRLSPAERLAERARLGFLDERGLPAEGPVVLCLAKLNEREAPWDVLRALAQMPSPRPWLALAGDGPERAALEGFVRAQGLDRVRFLGYIDYGQLPRLYAASDLFVHAAREERWGVSVAEAMACELPVVASTRVGAGHDLIAPGRNGFLYDSGDAGALAEALPAALALPRPAVRAANAEILARWGYSAAWQGILRAAAGGLRA